MCKSTVISRGDSVFAACSGCIETSIETYSSATKKSPEALRKVNTKGKRLLAVDLEVSIAPCLHH